MASWPMVVDHGGTLSGRCSYNQGSTHNHESEGKTVNLGWMKDLV